MFPAVPRLFLFVFLVSGLNPAPAQDAKPADSVQRLFKKNGEPTDPNFFPIAVWLESPRNAARYKQAGINLFVGLYQGPTDDELAQLTNAGMPVICDQNAVGLANKDNPIIAGWMHGDEPDNAQSLGKGKGYGPPIPPQKIVEEYRRMHAADPTRPVMLNLGQSVAWDNYIGRGVRRNHPEDYPEYVQGGDIVSFDIYPVVHESPEIAGKLEYVAHGVERLVGWTRGQQRVWNCLECTHIGTPNAKATPAQVRSEAWMSLIRGSQGLVYFVHQFAPSFKEAALLDDAEMLSAVTDTNRQIRELAPVLNSPTPANRLTVQSANSAVAAVLKQSNGDFYVFAVNLKNEPAHGVFELQNGPAAGTAEPLGESRTVSVSNGGFSDDFAPYAVHLYALHPAKS
jgi:hypothetical protein